MALKIRKDDVVEVIAGKDLGMRGKVLSVIPEKNRVLVEKVNFVYKHKKASQNQRGGILEVEAPIHISNVMVLSPSDNEPTRIGFKFLDDGTKVRFCKRTGAVLDK